MTNYEKLAEQFIKEWVGTWSLRESDEKKIRNFAKWLAQQELKCFKCGELLENHKAIPGVPGNLECPKAQQENKKESIEELKENMDCPKGQWYQDLMDKTNEIIKHLNNEK